MGERERSTRAVRMISMSTYVLRVRTSERGKVSERRATRHTSKDSVRSPEPAFSTSLTKTTHKLFVDKIIILESVHQQHDLLLHY